MTERSFPTLVVLVGPKGSGKSTLGLELERLAGVRFFETELVWLAYRKECEEEGTSVDQAEAQRRVRTRLVELLSKERLVSVATTGASSEILNDLLSVEARKLIVRLHLPLDECLRRIAQRDASNHIPVSEDLIRQVHRLSEGIELDGSLDFNTLHLSASVIAEKIAEGLRRL